MARPATTLRVSSPCVFYSFKRGGAEYLRCEFLCWSPREEDYDAKVVQDGKCLQMTCKLPQVFLNPLRPSTQHQELGEFGAANRGNNPVFQAAGEACTEVKQDFGVEPMVPTMIVKLPCRVCNNLECPFRQADSKRMFRFPHELNPAGGNYCVNVFGVSMRSTQASIETTVTAAAGTADAMV